MKRIVRISSLLFLLMNVVAIFHAYNFTHFKDGCIKTKKPTELSLGEKMSALAFGINNPKPKNETYPNSDFKEYFLPNNPLIHVWEISVARPKGIVVLFHGYSTSKSSLIAYSNEFLELGYSTIMVDFEGSGNSLGHTTTIGFKESQTVIDCFEYLNNRGENNIHLFGNSMGAVAILKAAHEVDINPKSIIVESPFGSMAKTVASRFEIMNVPSFPMAHLLVLWGGIINGFWAYDHNPSEYSKNIDCPVLLFHGEMDRKVSREEVDQIFNNLKGRKQFIVFESAKHENLLGYNKLKWKTAVAEFMK